MNEVLDPPVLDSRITLQSVEETIGFLYQHVQQHQGQLGVVGADWIRRAGAHLWDRLDKDLRGNHRPITTEQQALAVVKAIGLSLRDAATALHRAAEHLKNAGKVMPANETHLAYKRVLQAAEELLP